MIKKNFLKHCFLLILTFIILAASFFIPDAKSIFAEDNSKILICIDPGHGGKDCGATGPTGLKEKDVNLDIAVRLKNKLAGAGFRVIMTRESDVNHSIDEITNFANSNNADLFISVHNNSHPSQDMNGTQVFYYSQSTYGNVLASCLCSKIMGQIGTCNRGVKPSNFKVLRNTKMTSALVEGVFMSNASEEAKLKDAGFRDKIASGIYNGIVEFLNANGNNIAGNKKLASAQAFVKRVYHKSLNTDPDQTTLNNWADKLTAGTISHADVIRGVIISNQFNARNLTDSQYIDVLYKAVLDRNPDSTGAAHWLGQLKVLGRKAVLDSFLSSDEFASLVHQYVMYGYSYAGTIDGSAGGTAVNDATTSGNGTVYNLSILNGVGIKKIAAKTSELFKEIKSSDGINKYNIYVVADASSFNYKNTQIVCKSKDVEIMEAAQEVKTILGAGNIMTQNGNSQVSDIVVILGKDYSLAAAGLNTSTVAGNNTETIFVNVLNGKGAPGIAARAKRIIEAELASKNNIQVTEAKNAGSFGYKNTRIIIFTTKNGINDIASSLKKLLGTGEIIQSSNNVDNVDISIILGSDYKK